MISILTSKALEPVSDALAARLGVHRLEKALADSFQTPTCDPQTLVSDRLCYKKFICDEGLKSSGNCLTLESRGEFPEAATALARFFRAS